MNGERDKLVRLYSKAYLSLLGIIAAFIVVSIAQGAGWRPALAAMPLYVTLFVVISFKLIKDVMRLRRQRREEEGENMHR